MILSILVCTIPGREKLLARVMDQLSGQLAAHPQGEQVEVLTDPRDKSTPVGVKRQALLEQATGKYVCFVDDDDRIADDYIASILEATTHDPDCIGFKTLCHGIPKGQTSTAANSIRYKWQENYDGYRYVRSILHLNPVKREIALQAGFKDRRHGEDHQYSVGLVGKLKSEIFIDRHLYHYLYVEQPASVKYGIK